MSDFSRRAVERLVERARGAGVDVPAGLVSSLGSHRGSTGARLWAAQNPGVDDEGCCYGSVLDGPAGCECWVAEFEVEQVEPRPPAAAEDLEAQPRMCGDCAFRKGSPERSSEWEEEALLSLPAEGTPFWCHEGMRRPARWVHPDGRVVDGCPDDWAPPVVRGVPFRVDGRPGLLCAGWAERAARVQV